MRAGEAERPVRAVANHCQAFPEVSTHPAVARPAEEYQTVSGGGHEEAGRELRVRVHKVSLAHRLPRLADHACDRIFRVPMHVHLSNTHMEGRLAVPQKPFDVSGEREYGGLVHRLFSKQLVSVPFSTKARMTSINMQFSERQRVARLRFGQRFSVCRQVW